MNTLRNKVWTVDAPHVSASQTGTSQPEQQSAGASVSAGRSAAAEPTCASSVVAPGADEAPVPTTPFYTPAQVAALFCRTPRSIRLWAAQGLLTKVNVLGQTYYRRSEVYTLLYRDVRSDS